MPNIKIHVSLTWQTANITDKSLVLVSGVSNTNMKIFQKFLVPVGKMLFYLNFILNYAIFITNIIFNIWIIYWSIDLILIMKLIKFILDNIKFEIIVSYFSYLKWLLETNITQSKQDYYHFSKAMHWVQLSWN